MKTDDLGLTWEKFLPDSDEFDFSNVNHHGYCVDVYGDTLWVGTFKGINASFDGGKTWKNFSWPADNSENQDKQWPGNWVYSIEHKVANGKTHIWVGSDFEFNTGLGVYGICHSDDNGETWEYKTTHFNAWNFDFGFNGANDPNISDDTVIAASDSGLIISNDFGETWDIIDIRESDDISFKKGQGIQDVLVVADTLWVSSSDGLARSNDWGKSWKIYRLEPSIVHKYDTLPSEVTFNRNYPNPFNSYTTIEYSLRKTGFVQIIIYNIMGQKVRELVAESKPAGTNYVIWDGKDDNGKSISSGIYVPYIIQGMNFATGKIILLK